MDQFKLRSRRLFCDWQMPDFLPEVTLDVEHFVDEAVRIGAASIDFTTESAFGNCLYHSKIGRTNRVMRGDIFAEMCALAKERGLEVIAYYNMVLKDALGAEHPEWIQVDREGNPLRFESYWMFCMNTPFRERVFAQMEEIASLFEIDGFSYDLQYFHPKACFCPWCRERFEKTYGYPLAPEEFTEPRQWLDLNQSQVDTRREFIMTAMDRALSVRPNLAFTWNHSGYFSDALELDRNASFLASEAHPPDYLMCATKGKWMQASGKPFQFWMPESVGSWGHWSLNTAGTLKGTCALALAHGGAIAFNHVAPPCGDYAGRVFPGVYEMLGEVFEWVKPREELCRGKQSVPVVGVLYSCGDYSLSQAARLAATNAGEAGSPFADNAISLANYSAVTQMLAASHVPTDFFYSEDDLDRLDQYEVVVLPNTAHVDDKLAARLREYVAGGGRLVATYNTSLIDADGQRMENFALADVFGADLEKVSDYSLTYVDRFEDGFCESLPDLPVIVKDVGYQQVSPHPALYCRLRPGARSYASFTEPIIESEWENGGHIYHDHAPPGTITDWPAVIVNKFGDGMCALLPFPLLSAMSRQPSPWLSELFRSTLEVLGAPTAVKVEAPTSVQVVVTQDEEGWLVHLIRIQKETDAMFVDETEPPAWAKCELRTPWPVAGVERAMTGDAVDFVAEGEAVSFTIEGIADHDIIRVKK